eukprot:5475626-Prymnesium_polylepis.1
MLAEAAVSSSWTPQMEASAAVRAASAARAPAKLLTYGKDGRVKQRSVSAATRPAPLKRTSQAVASLSAAKALAEREPRLPLAEWERHPPVLRRPVGALPGELRLLRKQDGIAV